MVADPAERASLWRVREDGAGLSARLVGGGESWTGWEDSAVAPDQLADYLVAIKALLAEFGLTGVMYGHFGAGCMHIRIDFDQRTEQGRDVMSRFIRRAAELCVRFGGSMSGEHGDGRARSELLPLMYSPATMAAFSRFKQIWDPDAILNPGAIVDPEPLMDNLWLAGVDSREWPTSFDLTPAHDVPVSGFVHAVQGCIGVGRCRAPSGGVMCPSYRATGDEKDSTRGRARALQEMVRNSPTVAEGWRSDDVREALDLCLSCKACSTDCPVGVDMATYKSEFFDHYYRGRRRPMSHYSLGWLPTWLEITTRTAPLVNLLTRGRRGRAAARLGGLTTHRAMPSFASARRIRAELPAPPPAVTSCCSPTRSHVDSGRKSPERRRVSWRMPVCRRSAAPTPAAGSPGSRRVSCRRPRNDSRRPPRHSTTGPTGRSSCWNPVARQPFAQTCPSSSTPMRPAGWPAGSAASRRWSPNAPTTVGGPPISSPTR